ncbi:MAG: sigma-70 family RNA polymerase sigma factor [Anaerolineales bacterium]|nr:sigma-70 family RNA polymerase sigma factor [Anaerolineales bacterium]
MAESHRELYGIRELDPETISMIHNLYFPEIYRYANYRLGNPMVAEDVASEVFVRLLEAVHAGRGPKTSVRGWLFGTASNLIHDNFRHIYNKSPVHVSDEYPSNDGNPEVLTEQNDRFQTVVAASSQLTPEQQHVLALRFGSALSLKETAAVMNKAPNAIKALQFRALNALRRHLGDDFS